jgi:hypothetical protein
MTIEPGIYIPEGSDCDKKMVEHCGAASEMMH